jgi:hypothetical protein
MAITREQAYKSKETGEIVKMERVNSNQVVVHFSTGPERVGAHDLKNDYVCLGAWNDYISGHLEVDKPAE